MAIKYTKQYANVADQLYDYAKNTTLFDADTYKRAFDEGTANEYVGVLLDIDTKTSDTFDKAKYDAFDADAKYAYLMNEYYGDKKSEEYKQQAQYFNDLYTKKLNEQEYHAMNWLQKTGKTIGGFFTNTLMSAGSVLEGLIDASLYAATGGALIPGSKKLISKDLLWASELQEKLMLDYSGIDNNKFLKTMNDVSNGIVRMAPMIAGYSAAPLTGGVSATIGNVLYYGAMTGNVAEEAVKANPDINWGNLFTYTAGSVGSEWLVEQLSSKVGGALFGGKGAGVNWAAQIGIDFASEGVEEMASEIVGSLLYQWNVDPSAPFATVKDILYAGLIGGITGGLLSAVKVAGTSRFAVDENGNLLQMKDARKAGLKIDKSKRLSKGQSFTIMSQMTKLNENINQSNVIKLQEKYSKLSLNEIKEQHASEYKYALNRDNQVNERYVKALHDLGQVLKTIGETNFTKAVDILNYSYEKAATLMDNFKNNVNAYSVDAKTAQLLFEKANPGMNIAISEDLTKLERRLRDWLKSELNIDTFFGTVGSENGVDPGQIVTTGNNIFIQKGIFDTMSMDQVMETVVKRKIVDNVMQDVSKTDPETYAEAMRIVNETETTEYKNLTEDQKITLTQMLLYDKITIGKTFQRNKTLFQRIYNKILDLLHKNRNSKKTNQATKIEFHDLVVARNEYINMAADSIGNLEDAETFKKRFHMTDEQFETMLRDKFLPSILNEYYVLANDDNHLDAVHRNQLIRELLLNRVETDLTAHIDWNNITNEDYFVTEFIERVKLEGVDLEWKDALWNYIYDNYDLVMSVPNEAFYGKIDLVEQLQAEVRSELNDAVISGDVAYLLRLTNLNDFFEKEFLNRFDTLDVEILWKKTSNATTTARTIRTKKGTKIEVYVGKNIGNIQEVLMHEAAHALSDSLRMPFGTSQSIMSATLAENVPDVMIRGLADMMLTQEQKSLPLDQIIDLVAFQMYMLSKGEVYARGDAKAYADFKDGFVVDDNRVIGIGRYSRVRGIPFNYKLAKPAIEAAIEKAPKKKRISTNENTGTRFYDFIQENNIDLTKDFDEDFVMALENELLVTEKDFLRKINSDSVGNNKATNIVIDYFFGEKNKHLRTIEDVEKAINNLGAVYVYHMWRSQKDDNYSVKKSPTNEAIENFKKRKKVLTLTDKNGEEVVAATLIDRMDKRFKTARDNPKNSELKTYLLKMDYSQTGEQIAEIAKGVFGQFGINTQTLKTNNQQYEDEDGKTSQEIDNLADKEQQDLEQQAIEEIQGATTIFNTNDPDELIDTLETLASDVENWDTLVETDKKETVNVTTEEFKSLSKKDVVDAIEQKKTLYIIKDDKTTTIDLNDGRQYSVRGDTLFVKTDSGVLTDVAEISALTDTPEKITKTENVPTGKQKISPLGEFIRNKFNDTAIKQKLIKTFSEFIYDKIEEPFVNSELTDEQKASAEKSLAEKYSVEDVNKIKQLVEDKELSLKDRERRRKEILQEFEQKYGESIVEKIGTLIPDSKAGTDKKIVTQRKKLSKFENLTAEEQHLLNIDLKSLKISERLRLLERLQEANEKRDAKIAKRREVNAKKRKLNEKGDLTEKQQTLVDTNTTGFTEEQYDKISKELTVETIKASKTVKEVTKKATEAAKIKKEKTQKEVEKTLEKAFNTDVEEKIDLKAAKEQELKFENINISKQIMAKVDQLKNLMPDEMTESLYQGDYDNPLYTPAESKTIEANKNFFKSLTSADVQQMSVALAMQIDDEVAAAADVLLHRYMYNEKDVQFKDIKEWIKKVNKIGKSKAGSELAHARWSYGKGPVYALITQVSVEQKQEITLPDDIVETSIEAVTGEKINKQTFLEQTQKELDELNEKYDNTKDPYDKYVLGQQIKDKTRLLDALSENDNSDILDCLVDTLDSSDTNQTTNQDKINEIYKMIVDYVLNHTALNENNQPVFKKHKTILAPQQQRKLTRILLGINSFRYLAMLSSPTTAAKNAITNTAVATLAILEDSLMSRFENSKWLYADTQVRFTGDYDAEFSKYVDDKYLGEIKKRTEGDKYTTNELDRLKNKYAKEQDPLNKSKLLKSIKSIEEKMLNDQPWTQRRALRNLKNMLAGSQTQIYNQCFDTLNAMYAKKHNITSEELFNSINKTNPKLAELFISATKGSLLNTIKLGEQLNVPLLSLDTKNDNSIFNMAVYRANKIFFKVNNKINKAVNSLKTSDQLSAKIVGNAITLVVPFVKTTLNTTGYLIEHSPLGLINGIYKMLQTKATFRYDMITAIEQYYKTIFIETMRTEQGKKFRYTNEAFTEWAKSNISGDVLSAIQNPRQHKQLQRIYDTMVADGKIPPHAIGADNVFMRASAMESLAQGTMGTALLALGLVLGSLVDGFEYDDKDEYLGPVIRVGNIKIALNDLSPFSSVFTMGAMLTSDKLDNNMLAALDVLIDSTVLGTMDSSLKYSNSVKEFFTNQIINTATQLQPAITKRTAKLIYNTKKDKSGDFATKFLKTMASNSIIFNWLVPDKINPYTGEPMTYYDSGIAERIFGFALPVNFRVDVKTDLQREAERLGAGTSGLSGSFTINNKEYTLKDKEKTVYAKYRADYIENQYNSIVSGKQKVSVKMKDGSYKTTTYSKLTDEQKTNVLENLYSTATSNTKIKWWVENGNVYKTGNQEEYTRLRRLYGANIRYQKGYNKSKFIEV